MGKAGRSHSLLILCVAAFLLSLLIMPSASWSAALTWVGNGADADFNTPANWSPAQTPTLADTCTINSTNNRQPSILTTSECGSLTLGTGATLMTLTFSAGNDLTISGNVTIGSNGRIAPQGTPTGTFTIGGNWSDALATTNFTSSNLHLQYVFTGASRTISTNESFYDMSIEGSYTLNSNLTITNSMDIIAAGTFTQGPNIFTMNGTAFIISGTYNHTCSSTLVINSTLSLENGEHYPAVIMNSGSNVTGANPAYIDCDFTMQSGSTLNLGQLLFVSGNWINNGATVNLGTGQVIMSGAGKTIGGTTPTTFFDLIIGDSAGDSATPLFNTTVTNDLIVSAGATFTVQTNRNITVIGDTSISGSMYLSGTSTFTQEGYNTGIRVEAGGFISAQGADSANRVTFTRLTSYFDIVIDGGIDFNNVNVYYTRSALTARGFSINSPAGATVNLNNVAMNYAEDVNSAVMLYWNSNRTITASGFSFNSATYSGNDVNVEARQGTINFTNYSGNYAGESFDNDNGGFANWTVLVQFALASSSGPESTTPAVLTVILTSPSSQIVRVDYAVTGGTATGGGIDYTLANGTLTFNAGVTSRPINITINNDLIDELDETIQVTLQNPSNAALGSPTVHTYTIIDNDTAGVTVTQSGGSTNVTEGGATDTYTVVLTSQPTANVVITLTSSDTTTGVTTSVANLTFTPANWNTAQTVTVTAVNDLVDEPSPHTATITHTAASADTFYNGIAIASVTANITDNDTAGVTITQSGGSTDVVEGGATDTYTVVLNTQPTGNVVATVASTDTVTGVTVSAGTLTFTPANWNTAQTITVTAVDDFVVEGSPHTKVINHNIDTVNTLDANYDALAGTLASVTANITDNDTAGVTFTQSGGSTDVTEGGAIDSYTVVLNTQPTGDVVVTVNSTNTVTGVTVSVGNLTFTTANWNVAQTVTVTAVDDPVDETTPHTTVIDHDIQNGPTDDPNYDALKGTLASVTANITDNDTAGVTITQSGGSTGIAEGGVTDTYTAVLNTRPTANVVITITPDAQSTTAPVSLTFTPANWNIAQTVTVTAVDDLIDENTPHASTITHSAASADANYNGIPIANVVASVTDNDTAGVTITEPGGSVNITESGTTDIYTAVLTSQPTANVVITITPDAQSTVAPVSLTFTPANWNVAQTVTVTAVDDFLTEGLHTSTITHTSASADPRYNGIPVANVTANITDNDTPSVIINETGGLTAITEGGATDTYEMVLGTQPTANVTITISPDAQSTVAPMSLTFTPFNWNAVQTVTVTAVDDLVDEPTPHTTSISHSAVSADPAYNAIPIVDVTASITDNDTAGVTITQSGGSTNTAEGGATDTYTAVLTSQPTANVVITITPDAQSTTAPVSLTFTPANWNVAQTVTVTAVDDAVAEGLHTSTITHSSASADANYNAIVISNVIANITDNDSAGVTITQSSGSTNITEGGATDTYTVVLNSQPTANVTVTITPDSQSTTAPVSLTFTAANWNTTQTVTVTAVDDAVAEGAHTSTITHSAASADLNYNAIAITNVIANITDNDAAGVTITQSAGSTDVVEGGATDTYTAVLNSQPTANVTVTITPDSQSTTAPVSLTFTAANWNTTQTVTVTAVDDAVVEGAHTSTITHTAASVDPNYNAIPIASVTANITDNDSAGVTITQSGGSTNITEGGATDTYTAVLNSQPTANVTVTITPDSQSTTAPVSLTFTPANWSTAQTVTVTAVDDAVAEGAHASTITHSSASADGNYNAIAIASVVANVTDNDSAGVTIAESGGSTNITEGGATDTYTAVLTSQPTANVTITITPDAQSTTAPVSLTFTPANWNVAQTVTVTAVDDAVAEGLHTSTITHSSASADANYNAIVINNVIANITDNDSAGVTITQSGGSTNITEGGATDTYTAVLRSQPTANVVITITPDSQSTTAPVSLTFTPANWNVAQTVTVTAVDDAVAEGLHTSTITHSSASADANYNAIVINNVIANITDNDTAGVTITQSGGSTNITEGGATDTYTAVLNSQPTANVVITITPDSQSTVAPVSLTFTPANWNTAQTVTVTAVDDMVAEGLHTSTITHTAASADPNYNGIPISSVIASVTDNDIAGVTITQSGGSTNITEGGATDTYTVVLNTQPTANVVITVSPDTQSTVAPVSLTFTSGNWNVAQTVTVTAVDDAAAEGPHTSTISHTTASADGNYNAIAIASVVASITDNDTAGVTITQSGGSTNITEGGATDTYTAILTSQPTANVTITITPDAQSTTAPVSLTFTPANWNVAQTVTVTAVDDAVAEGLHTSTITHTAASVDPNYNAIPIASVVASITDNDTAGVTITQSGGSTNITEGGATDTYTAVLTSQPTANVTITITPDAQSTTAPISLTFTPANWNTAQTVTVTAVDDAVAEGLHTSTITHSSASVDANYNAIAIANVVASITDNDTAGVTITQSGGSTNITEGGATDTYTVVLNTQPTANVTVTITPDAQSTTAPVSLTFTSANWNTTQTVTVTAVDDAIAEGLHTSTITHSSASADANYNAIPIASVVASITDNDTAGVTITQSGGSTNITEGGATDTYTVVLNTQPTANVAVTITPDSQSTTAPVSLTFTSANWNAAQTVTVTAVDDVVAEGAHPSTITHSSASVDPNYNAIPIASVVASITDNDTAGVTITQSGGSTSITEGGATDTYTAVLRSQPIANVVITITPDSQSTTAPVSLTFTPANWNTAQTVTVTAVDDVVAEGAHTSTISHSSASVDPNYNAIAIASVVASITDNDTAGVTITQSGGSTNITEGGATDTYTVVLNTQPTANVTITITPDSQSTTAPISLIFTPANWNTAQTVTVTAVNDAIAEGLHTSTITHSAASVDANYNAIAIPSVIANITDNDTAGVTITQSGGSTNITEGGATDTYTAVLTSQPTANVTITITPDSQSTTAPVSLTFTNANWNTTQTVTVTAVDDAVAEGPHTSTITHSASSTDGNYNAIPIASVLANITDNDTAGVTITQSGGSTSITEGGATDTYTVVLRSQPTANVVITIIPDSQSTTAPVSLTFTPANWNTAQTVTVTAVDDIVAEGLHTSTIAHTATSTDGNYNAIAIASVVASITDNDTAGVTITQSGGSTNITEGGATDTYSVVLNTQPTANVVISVSPDSQSTVAPVSLTFTSGNWNVAQTVTVTAVDDAVAEGPHTSTISHTTSSADGNYNAIAIASVVANVTDNDTAGVTITQSGGSTNITEGGATDTYTAVLRSQPTANVVITIIPDSQSTTAPVSLTFTSANWNTTQTVTVTAVDDAVAEGPHTSTITHSASSTDGSYNAIPIASVIANITDNDTAGVTITQSGGSTNITEGGATDTYTVVLNTQPTANVTVTITPDAQSTTAPVSLTFTSANWNVAQTVTVTAVNDLIAEGLHTSTITHTATSTDGNYNAIAIASVVANITDNDIAGVTITQSGGSTNITEGGATDTYTVVLNTQPTANVTVTITPDAQSTTAPVSLTFTPANWNTTQTVTVTAVNDAIAEGLHTSTITHSAASVDANYNAIPIASVVANITDNDIAGVTITQSGGSTNITEGGATDTYTVVLNTQPTANVAVTITPDSQSTTAPVSLTFTPANWNAAQTVTVTAVDDAVAEGAHTSTITHSSASADSYYNAIAIASVVANITDNDTAGVTITQSGGSTNITEGGATDTYTVVLNTQPTANVAVTITPDSQSTTAPVSLTFTPANWNTAQTVTVTAVNDLIAEGLHTSTITHSSASADGNYNAIPIASVVASITDNDTAGVTITQSGGSTNITEGGATDTYTVVLNTQPTANVTVTITPDSQSTTAPVSLTFTPANWNAAQTVTVTAVDDAVAEGAHTSTITHSSASADSYYNAIAVASVIANVTDNDTAGVTITQSGGSTNITEGGATDTYTAVLRSQPTANVTITITPDSQSTTAPVSLTFTSANWNTAQTVTVTAVDDMVAEGLHTSTITHTAASVDANYNAIAIASVVATITDNDIAGATITQSGGSTNITEGGAIDTYTVVLNTQPTANVAVTITPDSQSTTAPVSLTFTSANWNVAQTVTVTAVDDAVAEGLHTSTITHGAASVDPNYNAIPIASVVANITDNDTAGATITQSGGSTNITEGGATDTYTAVLRSQPTANVVITVSPDTQSTIAPVSLTFTSANWNVAQTVTVTAIDDVLAEGFHTSTITHSAASVDSNYNSIPIASVIANITDNDTAGVTITQSGGSTNITEGGATDTYTVMLRSQPTANVVITVSPDTQSTIAPVSLTFTSANWNVAQTVTVTAVDDMVAEGLHTSTITHSSASVDANFNAIAIASVVANITDNDTAGVTITQSGGSTNITEGGATDTYTAVLRSQPAANVVITITPDSQSASAPVSLTFTSANWNVAQTVTITAVDDAVAEGPHTSTITHTAASTDSNYNGIPIGSVTAAVTDNDTAGVTITQSGGSTNITEGGATDTYTVVLRSQPTANVTITITPDAQSTTAPVSLTFTSANWNAAQTVTVTAVNDAVAEGPHTSTIAHAAASTDGNYNAIAIASVVASVTDNDTAGVTIAQSGGSTNITEGGTADTYTVILNSQPTANVVITVSPDTQSTVAPVSLTFTSGNWNVAQTVTVTAVDDAVVEGPHSSTVTHSAASADSNYNAIAIGNIAASITDNDTAGVTITQSGGSTNITEGGATDTYTAVLRSQPTANVTVTITPDSQSTTAPVSLTFTPANWNVAQTVTVTAVDDAVAEGPHTSTITHSSASADANYNAIAIVSVVANIADNDIAGVTLTQSGGSTNITEAGATDTYTVVLRSMPNANVMVMVSPDSQSTPAPVSLTFTPANWNVAQTVTVTAVNDAVAEGAHTSTITHSAASVDPNYNAIAIASVVANITDNDTSGVTITQSGGTTNITEGGGTDTYTAVLTSQPTANVVITVSPDAQSTTAPVSLTFTSANWNVAQTVTVSAVNDAVAEGAHTSTITHSAASVDPNYNAIPIASVLANVTDNDIAGVTITQSGGSTNITEGSTTDTYTVVLNSQPTANVTITVTPDSQSTTAPVSLTFTSANWNTAQTVTVSAVNDTIAEGIHSSTIPHTAASVDANYNAIAVASIVATVTDNDTAGVTITQSGGTTNITEGGATDTYTVVLNTQPTANVTVTIAPDSQSTTAPVSLSFTPANWNTAQTVTITAVDDAVVEAVQTSTVTHSSASADPNYNAVGIASVIANITDNDTASTTSSTISVSPEIVVADGVQYSTITVVIRDVNGSPIPNKTITFTSDRGASDTVVQPAVPTDANGVATGRISSTNLGNATITATDVTDGIDLTQKAGVYFSRGRVLNLSKIASKKEASVGDVVTYLIEIRNTTNQPVSPVTVSDQIPPNFKYLQGSARLNGGPLPDPSGNRALSFTIPSIPALVDTNGNGQADPGESGYSTIAYQLVIGSGATPGDYNNRAVAWDVCDSCYVSNIDEVLIAVALDPLFDLGTIIGKVFEDKNSDGWQDSDESGVPGAMVALDDGTYAITDEYGRYHFPAVNPGHRLVKINIQSLTSLGKATTDEAVVVPVTPGLLAKANFGVVFKQEIESIGHPAGPGLLMQSEDTKEPIQVMGNIETLDVLINGQMAQAPQEDIKLSAGGIDEVIQMKGDQFDKPIEFHISIDDPQLVKEWKLSIMDAQGNVIRTLENGSSPSRTIRWNGMTDGKRLVKSGEIYQYQLELQHTDGSRSRSPRRVFGVNKVSAISLNMSGNAFESGSDELSAKAKESLKSAADLLRKYPKEKVVIEGHTDSVGEDEFNLELSKRRAEAALNYFVTTEHLKPERFILKWYGKAKPIASNEISEGRELNRRVEVKGIVEDAKKLKLTDQYRTTAIVSINGGQLPVDDQGRFSKTIDDERTDRLKVQMVNAQGRSLEASIPIPNLEIVQPKEEVRVPYGSRGAAYEVRIRENEAQWNSARTALVYNLVGRTDVENTVELDGKPMPLRKNGSFIIPIELKMGNNGFGLVVRNKAGYTRIVNLMIAVSSRDEKGDLVIAVSPIPNLTVKLPPRGEPLKNPLLTIQGTTDPENRITVNKTPVTVQPDGTFITQIKLPEGKSVVAVTATDPEGNPGTIEREVELSDTRMFFLAFGDGKVSQLTSKGYLQGAGTDKKDDLFTEGRIAYYLKGVVLGKYLVTSAFDTGERKFEKMFTDLDDTQNTRLLTNLDPDKLYPVYGDSSTIVYDAESQGKFYLAVDSDEFHLLFGSYSLNLTDTELATYQRTLYGGRLTYQSVSRTKYGSPNTEIAVFGAEVRQIHVVDELSATGGSLYYLSHQNIIEGSEQVTILVKDKNTGLTLSRAPQRQNVDYTIKYEEGRILFGRPISSVVEDSSLINQTLLHGNPVFIQIDYETQLESFEKTAAGGRVRKQIGDHVSVGGTYVQDELSAGKYELKGVDTEVRLAQNTRFVAEYAESSGTNSSSFISTDGGLTFTESTPTGEQDGKAWKLAAEIDAGEWIGKPDRVVVGGYIKKLDSGFLSSGNILDRGAEKSGVHLKLQLTDKDKVLARYDREENDAPLLPLSGKQETGTVQYHHAEKRWEFTGEFQSLELPDSTNTALERSTFAAGRIKLKLTDTLTMGLEHQQTISGEENNQTTLGIDYQILPSLALQASGTLGSLGNAAQGGAVLKLGDKSFYLKERLAEDQAGNVTTTIIGTEAPLDPTAKVYTEYQWERSDLGARNLSIVGAQKQWEATKGLKLLVAGEQSRINSDAEDATRYTIATSLSYAHPAGFTASTRNEVRNENGTHDRTQFLTANRLELKLTPDITFLGTYRYSLTKDTEQDRTEAKFEEFSVGLALRPVRSDRFNALSKYTHLSDQRPLSLGQTESVKTTQDVASIDWLLEITKQIEWAEKLAFKMETEEALNIPAITINTYLIINRLNFNIWRTLYAGAEYRILMQKEADDTRKGWVAEIMWEVVKHMRVGAGYNFTDFSDNEFSDNNYSVEGWFVRMQAKF